MKIIVIGAGLAGAATAHALAVRGCEVTVLEASEPCALPSPGALASLGAMASPSPSVATAIAAAAAATPSAQREARSAPSAGLPVALLAPHQTQAKTQPYLAQQQGHPHTPDGTAPSPTSPTSPLTQLSRLGVATTLQAARSLLLEGQDWQLCGALQRAGKLGPQAHWFGDAAWIKPAALVAAWLAHPRITVRTGALVHSLRRRPLHKLHNTQGGDTAAINLKPEEITIDDLSNSKNTTWQVLLADGQLADQAHTVVLANAYQAQALLAQLELNQIDQLMQPGGLPKSGSAALGLSNTSSIALAAALHQVAGQVIYGPWTADWQALWPTLLHELAQHSPQSNDHTTPCAINGNGHFIPAVPWQGGYIWLSGSTYEHDAPHNPRVTAQGMASNLQRLQQLIPGAGHLLAAQHSAGLVEGWAGTRCTTRDRLPMVGAVSADHAPGLYVCSAMGSRGLSFAALCGQHVAAQIMQASSPLPDDVRRAIDVARFF